MVGELLKHREARFLLAIEIAAFQGDHLGGLMFAVNKGALQREVHEAFDQVAIPDWNLPQHQRYSRCRLQGRKRLADALVGAVDLVEKQKALNPAILEFAHDDLKLR